MNYDNSNEHYNSFIKYITEVTKPHLASYCKIKKNINYLKIKFYVSIKICVGKLFRYNLNFHNL